MDTWIACIPYFTSWGKIKNKKFSREPDEAEKTKSKRLKI
jgi:hypothetical protein